VGLSYEKTHLTDRFLTSQNAPLVALLRLLGPGILRIGANDVDRTNWQPDAPPAAGNGTTSTAVGTADVDLLAGLLEAAGWRAIYGLGAKTATPEADAAEATYVAAKLGARLLAFEIGNEINFYGPYSTVRPRWDAIATAVHAAVPGALVAGPADAADPPFVTAFVNDEAQQIALLTHHYYRGDGASPAFATMANLLAEDPAVASHAEAVEDAVRRHGIAHGFRWGELNSFYHHGAPGVSDTLGAALWAVDFMLRAASYGAAGVNFHGGGSNMDGNGCNRGSSSCARPFVYSPIVEADSRVTGVAAVYYALLLVSRAGTGDLLATTATAPGVNLRAYAIALGDGATQVVLINKDATTAVEATVDAGTAVASADVVRLGGPALTATTNLLFAGSVVSPIGEFAPRSAESIAVHGHRLTVLVPPASVAVVRAR
jgi:hypothetical protein